MIYTIKDFNELQGVVDDIKLGKDTEYAIVINNNKVILDFSNPDKPIATVLPNDGKMQINPFYKLIEVEKVEEVKSETTEEVKEEVKEEQPCESVCEEEPKVDEQPEEKVDESDNNKSEIINELENKIEEYKSVVASQSNELDIAKNAIETKDKEINELTNQVAKMDAMLKSTDTLVGILAARGYKVHLEYAYKEKVEKENK